MKIEVTLLLILLELFICWALRKDSFIWVPEGIRTCGFPEWQLGDLNSPSVI